MKIDYYLKYWLPVIVWMGLIYYLSSLSNPIQQIIPEEVLIYFDFERFMYHIIEYLILSLLIYRALKNTIDKNIQTSSILITILYAIIDELHQSFVPGRIPSVWDIAVDSFGAISMQCIVNVYNYIKDNIIKT